MPRLTLQPPETLGVAWRGRASATTLAAISVPTVAVEFFCRYASDGGHLLQLLASAGLGYLGTLDQPLRRPWLGGEAQRIMLECLESGQGARRRDKAWPGSRRIRSTMLE